MGVGLSGLARDVDGRRFALGVSGIGPGSICGVADLLENIPGVRALPGEGLSLSDRHPLKSVADDDDDDNAALGVRLCTYGTPSPSSTSGRGILPIFGAVGVESAPFRSLLSILTLIRCDDRARAAGGSAGR